MSTFKRTLGIWSLLFAAIGGMFGSGRLFGPFLAAQVAGPAAVLSWIIGGLLMIVVALTFAELSSTFPLTGGSIRFMQLSHGPLVSFTMAWIGWIASVAVAPVETMAMVQYASHYFPWLMFEKLNVHLLTYPGMIVAAIVMLLMCFVNVAGSKSLSKTNNILVWIKLLVSTLTIVILMRTKFESLNFIAQGFSPQGLHGILSALPSAGVIFSFIGYSPAIQLAGEAKNPQRDLPIAIIGALLICMVFYAVLQIAFVGALPSSAFAHGWLHLSFAGDAGPFVGLAAGLGLFAFVRLLSADAMLSPFGTGLLFTGSTARMCYAMGKNGYMFPSLMKLNRFGVPQRIIFLDFLIGLLLFLPFPTWQNMMSFLVSSLVLAYAVGPLSLVVLRQLLPDVARPFKLPYARVLCCLAFYICNLIVYWTGWSIVSKMCMMIAAGYVVLLAFRRTASGRRLQLDFKRSAWVFLYIASLLLMSYVGDFGGGRGYVPFGWDFLGVAVISLLIYELAIRRGSDSTTAQAALDDL